MTPRQEGAMAEPETIEDQARVLVGRRVAVRETTPTYTYLHVGRLTSIAAGAYVDLMELADGRERARVHLRTVDSVVAAEDITEDDAFEVAMERWHRSLPPRDDFERQVVEELEAEQHDQLAAELAEWGPTRDQIEIAGPAAARATLADEQGTPLPTATLLGYAQDGYACQCGQPWVAGVGRFDGDLYRRVLTCADHHRERASSDGG